jgi:hypothetical protein
MNATVPCFFLSYSHVDWDTYLDRFYEDLVREVKRLSDDGDKVHSDKGFRDLDDIKTGDIWHQEILNSVSTAHVLVCIYSVHYFSRRHPFCAKEFGAFLMRAGLVYNWYYDGGKRLLGIAKAKNLLPVLWLGEEDLLKLNDLPPPSVRSIKYDLSIPGISGSLKDAYKTRGMLAITRRRRAGTYWTVVEGLAREIVRRAKHPPPPLQPKPALDELPNPFWDPPPSWAQTPLDAGPGMADPATAAPPEPLAAIGAIRQNVSLQIVTVELRRGVPLPEWAPYPNAPSLASLVAEAAQDRRLALGYFVADIEARDFPQTAAALLVGATQNYARPILLVDPRAAADAAGFRAVRDLITQDWLGGVIVPAAAEDQEAVRRADRFRNALQLPAGRSERLVIRGATLTAAEFRTAVISLADEILSRIVQFGIVRRNPPLNDGPAARPRISNATST